MNKKIFLRTFGCQMNVRDSEVICGLLVANGYRLTTNQDEAGIIIFNTCSVRQHAEDKVWSEIGRIGKIRTEHGVQSTECAKHRTPYTVRRTLIIGIIGCMANNYREAIFERAPQVDFVVGTRDIAKIPEIIKEIEKHKKTIFEKKIYETDGILREDEIYHTGFHLDKEHAFVVIQEGCENCCAYCVVPYVRGKIRSRPAEDIIREIEEDIKAGITKITLLGQNVNAYKSVVSSQKSAVSFVGLLKMIDAVKGLREFTFVTSHPKDTGIELFKAMAELDKLKKCLHLPVQSGSDRILKLMNRGYTRNFYLELAKNYRKIVKGAQLTTDIIVGFPGETERDFQETFDLMKEAKFNSAFIFKYSPRPRTRAAEMIDDVPKQEKERRHRLILDLQKEISRFKAVNDR